MKLHGPTEGVFQRRTDNPTEKKVEPIKGVEEVLRCSEQD